MGPLISKKDWIELLKPSVDSTLQRPFETSPLYETREQSWISTRRNFPLERQNSVRNFLADILKPFPRRFRFERKRRTKLLHDGGSQHSFSAEKVNNHSKYYGGDLREDDVNEKVVLDEKDIPGA